jgi:aspartate dehydrogenase
MRVGLIGCGNIGRPVARALLRGQAGPHRLCAILGRTARDLDGMPVTADVAAFYASGPELIVEAGGPEAFRQQAARALRACPVIAVSPLPLADPALERELGDIARATGHGLRIAPGAIGGLDAIATAMAAGLERLQVFVELGPADGNETVVLFEGSVREAARRFPDEINVAATVALAGPGLDATHVLVTRPPRGASGRSMGFQVASRAGRFEVVSRPRVVPAEDIHMAAASVIALLRDRDGGIRVG